MSTHTYFKKYDTNKQTYFLSCFTFYGSSTHLRAKEGIHFIWLKDGVSQGKERGGLERRKCTLGNRGSSVSISSLSPLRFFRSPLCSPNGKNFYQNMYLSLQIRLQIRCDQLECNIFVWSETCVHRLLTCYCHESWD